MTKCDIVLGSRDFVFGSRIPSRGGGAAQTIDCEKKLRSLQEALSKCDKTKECLEAEFPCHLRNAFENAEVVKLARVALRPIWVRCKSQRRCISPRAGHQNQR